jgi:hypothetical protein
LVADVQTWLDNPGVNFGWVLLTEREEVSETSRRFASREDTARAPELIVEYASATPQFQITSISATQGQVFLSWANGRPTYQIQGRASLRADWVNIGQPITNTTAAIALDGEAALLRIVSDYTAQYEVTFDATWSRNSHPTDFPDTAHWSGLVGGVHNDRVHFFREGETASEGIRMMAELGSQPRLLSEVAAALTNGTAHFQLSGGGINPSPGSRQLIFPQPMRRDFSFVTLCSMVAPSPDWFVGVDSLNMIENGGWVSNKVVTLYAYDAGTDSGVTYLSPDEVTVPRGVVKRITGFPAMVNDAILPFGTFTFRRLD